MREISQNTLPPKKKIGFWGAWSMTVCCMIGSGIFLLPTVLAPYGMLGFGGWVITGMGSIMIAVVLGKLSARTNKTGGPGVFVQEAFGDIAGFIVSWSLWISYVIGLPTIAIAFTGYAGSVFPALGGNVAYQALTALVLMWSLTLISIKGTSEATFMAIIMTVLKLIPLAAVLVLSLVSGTSENLPPLNPSEGSIITVLAATSLLTMWAFLGLDAGVVAADDVENPEKTIPRAISLGVLVVCLIYMLVTLATMALVPADILAASEAPLLDAAKPLGKMGHVLIGLGAMAATAGSLHACIFVAGQLSLGAAQGGLSHPVLARKNSGNSPYLSLLVGVVIASVLLLLNFSKGLVGAFTFLLMMATATALLPYFVCALVELKYSLRSSLGWCAIAFIAGLYAAFAIVGSGLETLFWGGVLILAGLPIYFIGRFTKKTR